MSLSDGESGFSEAARMPFFFALSVLEARRLSITRTRPIKLPNYGCLDKCRRNVHALGYDFVNKAKGRKAV